MTARRRTRILYVEINEDGTVGGSYQCLHDLACGIDPDRYEPIVLFYRENPWVARLRERGVRVLTWDAERRREHSPAGLPGRAGLALRIADAVRRRISLLLSEKIDVVHLNNSPSVTFQTWLPAARVTGRPCITHARGNVFVPRHRWQQRLMATYDRVVPISRYMESQVLASGIPRDRVTLVHDGIDLDLWRRRASTPPPAIRQELGVRPDGTLILMVGHLKPWKGQLEVLHALNTLTADQRAGLRVAFAGEAPPEDATYLDALGRAISGFGLGDTALLLGRREDVPSLMRAADVVVHASIDPEPFGLVLVEALALGVPVVAAASGGPLDVVTPDTGMLVNPRDPRALGGAIVRLATDPALRRQLGAAGPGRASGFSLSRTIAGVEAIYQTLEPER